MGAVRKIYASAAKRGREKSAHGSKADSQGWAPAPVSSSRKCADADQLETERHESPGGQGKLTEMERSPVRKSARTFTAALPRVLRFQGRLVRAPARENLSGRK